LLCSLVICFSIVSPAKTCFAQEAGVIYIRADGSIDPLTASISTIDSITYTFTSDIFDNSIVIERDNIVVDGTGFTLQGESAAGSNGIDLTGRTNVTIKNIVIACARGISLADSSGNSISGNSIAPNYGNAIYLSNSSGNSISGNNITANYGSGVFLEYYSSNNTISENNIENNTFVGIKIMPNSNDNKICHNNFMNNTINASASGISNVWDDGSKGNYWSDYSGIDANHDGIGDTPYIINVNNIDHYPLITQYVIPEFPSFLILPLFMIATLLAIAIYKRRILTRAP
jgi:parallel beta-helix repeat protein